MVGEVQIQLETKPPGTTDHKWEGHHTHGGTREANSTSDIPGPEDLH